MHLAGAVTCGPVLSGRGSMGMGLRARLSGMLASQPAPRIVEDLDDAAVAESRELSRAGNWPALRERLSAVVDDGRLLSAYVDQATRVPGVSDWMAAVLDADPDAPLVQLFAGAHHVRWGWEARTGARAEDVSREQFRVFHERLGTAERFLYDAAEGLPGSAAPWYFLQMSGRGLEVGPDVARLRFEATVKRCPEHAGAHRQQLQQVCRKWGGSHGEMHAFARDSALKGRAGNPMGELVAIAHLEHWLDLPDGEDDAYMRGPAVAADLHQAADHTVRHPAYGRELHWVHAFNAFAMAFWLADDRKAAAGFFAELEGRVDAFPWSYLNGNDPAAVYRKARNDCRR